MANNWRHRVTGGRSNNNEGRVGTDVGAYAGIITHDMVSCFQGHWGDDQFFANMQYKNGWSRYRQPYLISGIGPFGFDGADGMAMVMPGALNAPSALVDVSWWINVMPGCASELGYNMTIYIQGPLGTSDGIVGP
jgi:hypothetical protein